jgi:signal peptidase II
VTASADGFAPGSDGPGTAAPRSARDGAGARAIALRLAVVLLLVALDLWSKQSVFAWLGDPPAPAAMEWDAHGHHRLPIAGRWFGFMLTTNPGMAWGFDKLPPWLLVGGRCAAVAFLAYLLVRTPRSKSVLTVALVLILAGAAGNLYDNLLMPPRPGASFGEVRDFIDVYFPRWDYHFPTFNVADSCISVGAVLLLLSSFFAPASEREPAGGARVAAPETVQ